MTRNYFRKPLIAPRSTKVRRIRLKVESLEHRDVPAGSLTNAIVQENSLPGNPASEWDISGIGDATLQGFATDISVNVGGTVNFKINDTQLADYSIDIYRIGYYQGLGARKVATIANPLRQAQPAPLTDPSVGLVDCGNWSVSASWAVPQTAVSGVYLAVLRNHATGGSSHIIFIVRNDASHSDVLFQTSDTTWEAYNHWGGDGLYFGGPGQNPSRAYAVSYNRPFQTRADTPKDWFFSTEYPMIRWMEKNGYDVTYFTGVDSDRYGSEILNHKLFTSVGHDEYWSGQQRANVVAARDAGVNLAFFSGDEMYWRTRWQTSIDASGTPYRTMVCYKETYNTGQDIDPSNQWTGTFRDPSFPSQIGSGQPENAVTGQLFTVDRGPGGDLGTPFTVPASFANLRFWRNTSVARLQAGQTASLGDYVLGYEVDEDADNGFRPAGLLDMSQTTQSSPDHMNTGYGALSDFGPGTFTHSLTLYRASSGALVFGAGTIQWSWGLDGTHDQIVTTPDPAMQQATVNLFADMGVQPVTLQSDLVTASLSTDVVAPTTAITSITNGATVTAGIPVTISGTASDTGGGVVAAVEVSVDGGNSWHRATGRSNWTYTWTPTPLQAGQASIRVRAVDDSANLQSAATVVNVTVNLQSTASTGLVAAYNFDEASGTTVNNSAGSGNTGAISGATRVVGHSGGALSFNGTSDIVTVNDSTSLHLTSGMTLEAWIKPADLQGWTSVILKERGTTDLSYGLYASDNTSNPPSAYLYNGTSKSVLGSSRLPLNAWSYLAATYDGTALNLYVNGQLAQSTPSSGNITTSTNPLRIGGDTVYPDEYFNGLIDDVRIYNRALNASEIFTDMSTPVGGTIDSMAPSVSISSPTNGASVSGTATIATNTSDNTGISQVSFYANNQLIGTSQTAPFSFSWNTSTFTNGSYTLTAVARDFAGNQTTSAGVNVTVANSADVTAPTVNLTTPPNGALLSGVVPLSAVASDNIGVASVEFKVNGTSIGIDSVAPYTISWNSATVADGTYSIVAIAKDAANNTTTSTSVQITVDNTAPTVASRSPSAGATGVSAGAQVTSTLSESIQPSTISFVLRDPNGNVIPASVSYDDTTKLITLNPNQDLGLNVTYTATLSAIRDLANNAMAPVTWSFTTSSTITNASFWGDGSTTPTVASAQDSSAQELGFKFKSDIDGYITGLRFYKGGTNTGTHLGHLWTSTGTLMASVTFANETANGWQEATFSSPVHIAANTTYVASYYAPNGGYAFDGAYFASEIVSGPLHALASGASGGNGVFLQGGGFPTNSYNAANYWVDVRFSNTLADVVPPTVTAQSPSPNATGVPQASNVVATFSESVQPATISFVLKDSSNNVVPANVAYNDTNHTVTLDPTSDLASLSSYSVTLSGAKDLAGNTMAAVVWSFTAGGVDTTPPAVAGRFPAINTTNASLNTDVVATFSESIQPATLVFTLKDPNGNVVPADVTYSDATHQAILAVNPNSADTSGTGNELLPSTTYTAMVSGALDLAGNAMSTVTWSFTTAAAATNAMLFAPSATPALLSANDTSPQELGVKFSSSVDGFITGIRFYKGSLNTGTHIGHIWDANGNLLGTATFANETSGGWQQVTFSNPVPVVANALYVASYYAPVGGYAFTGNYFSGPVTNGVLTAPASAGVFRNGLGGGFPNLSYNAANYWVDVVFNNTLADLTPPIVTGQSPASGATNISTATNVSATFSEPVNASIASFVLKDQGGNTIAATVTYDSTTNTLTLDPTAVLAGSSTFTATLSNVKDPSGNTTAPTSWSFTTGGVISNASLWTSGTSPAFASANDFNAQELGMKFKADRNGYITGIRFYKGSGNTGTHVAHLWTSAGTLLATATFTAETATGWQQVNFNLPVAIAANTIYVASYYAPNGGYAYDHGYFNNSFTNGALTAPDTVSSGGNGLYRLGTGGGFPSNSYNSSNYWVDVIFTESLGDTTAPTVTAKTPAANLTGVDKNTVVTATLSELVQGGTISFTLKDQLNNPVSASVTYASATNVVTLTPNTALQPLTTYTATISGATDAAGNVMSAVSWSFTVQGIWSQTTAADFAAGSNNGTIVTSDGGGALQLAPGFSDDFAGTSLSSNWATGAWGAGNAIAVTNGTLSVQGSQVLSGATYVSKPVEASINFGATPYQHFGWATGLDSVGGDYWAIFSTGGTSNELYARVNALGNSQQDVDIGGLLTGFHTYRIEPSTSGFNFYVDGSLKTSIAIAFPTVPLRVAFSSYNGGTAPALQADWVRVANYSSTGTYTSAMFDAGQTVSWQSINWTSSVPTGTTIRVEVSVSDSPSGSSNWTVMTNGQSLAGMTGRYFQYRITFTTTDSTLSASLSDITFTYA